MCISGNFNDKTKVIDLNPISIRHTCDSDGQLRFFFIQIRKQKKECREFFSKKPQPWKNAKTPHPTNLNNQSNKSKADFFFLHSRLMNTRIKMINQFWKNSTTQCIDLLHFSKVWTVQNKILSNIYSFFRTNCLFTDNSHHYIVYVFQFQLCYLELSIRREIKLNLFVVTWNVQCPHSTHELGLHSV